MHTAPWHACRVTKAETYTSADEGRNLLAWLSVYMYRSNTLGT